MKAIKKTTKDVNFQQFKVVKNMNLLKSLEKKGIIKFDQMTGKKIEGLYSSKKFTCYYIDEAPSCFEYKGRFFGREYFSGCFSPYLVEYSVN